MIKEFNIVIIDLTNSNSETSSVSLFVAEIQKNLEAFQREKKLKFQLTPMSTILEGEL